MNRHKALALLLALCMLLLLPACGGEDTYTLRTCLPEVPSTLDPAMVTTQTEQIVVSHLFENLMKRTSDGSGGYKTTNGAARSHQVETDSNGQQIYTFTLRSGLTWSDGQAVTAADFVYAWQRLADPATGSPNAQLLSMVAGYDQVRSTGDVSKLQVSAPNENTFVVVLSQPTSYFLDEICTAAATMPVRADAVSQEGWSLNPQTLLTNGPYQVQQWQDDVLTASVAEDYYDARRLGPDVLEFRFQPDTQAAMELYESGEVDFVLGLSDEMIAQQGENYLADPLARVTVLIVNQMSDSTIGEKLRQAMSLVIPRSAITQELGAQRYWPAEGLIPYGIRNTAGADYRTAAGPMLEVDPELYDACCQAARELIAGQTLPSSGITLTFDSGMAPAAEQIRDAWEQELGLSVTLQPLSAGDLATTLSKSDFTVALTTLSSKINDASAFLDDWTSDSQSNVGHIHSTAYDLLLRIIGNSDNAEARDAYLVDAERLLLDNGQVIPVYCHTTTWLLRSGLTGLFGSGTGLYHFTGVVHQSN